MGGRRYGWGAGGTGGGVMHSLPGAQLRLAREDGWCVHVGWNTWGVLFGVWCVPSDVWCVVCAKWCVSCGVCQVVCDVWCVVCALSCVMCGMGVCPVL